MNELTIRQYAKISEIPLKLVLDALKNSGFTCNADDVVNKDMQKKLLKWYRQEYCRLTDDEKRKLTDDEKERKIARDAKAARAARAKEAAREKEVNEQLPLIRKRGQVIDLCFELLPEVQRVSIMQEMNNQKISGVYVQSYYDFLCTFNRSAFFKQLNISGFYRFHPTVIKKYGQESQDGFETSIDKFKKQKHYTSALMNTIGCLICFESSFSFIGELFIDMGAIDSALKLYEIDQSLFSNPNTLSLLASNAIKIGNLEWSVKLIDQLIKQEPYHPSIPILQSDIKRLEQRSRLKSALSIDFSKIDELSGVAFENLLLDKFSTMGFKVESTPKTGDFGADLIVENSEGSRIIVQCKRFKAKVNLKAVQEVVGAMGHYAGDYGVVITNNSFLNSAIKLAESHDIELWDGDKLVSFLAGDLSFSEIIGTPD